MNESELKKQSQHIQEEIKKLKALRQKQGKTPEIDYKLKVLKRERADIRSKLTLLRVYEHPHNFYEKKNKKKAEKEKFKIKKELEILERDVNRIQANRAKLVDIGSMALEEFDEKIRIGKELKEAGKLREALTKYRGAVFIVHYFNEKKEPKISIYNNIQLLVFYGIIILLFSIREILVYIIGNIFLIIFFMIVEISKIKKIKKSEYAPPVQTSMDTYWQKADPPFMITIISAMAILTTILLIFLLNLIDTTIAVFLMLLNIAVLILVIIRLYYLRKKQFLSKLEINTN